ncbi:MAG: hypothetical protein ACOCVF_02645 [bacterium]
MKHLKIFENKILDDILDKISEYGETSLTSWEREYLSSYDTPKSKEMEKEKSQRELKYISMGEYDPRKDDKSSYDAIGDKFGVEINWDDWDDEDIYQSRIEIFWDELDQNDMNEFLRDFKIVKEMETKPWHKLPEKVKSAFEHYLIQKGYIENKG